MKIDHFNPKPLRNSAHFQYMEDFKRQIDEEQQLALKIQPMPGEFTALLGDEDSAYKKTIKSALTAQIKEADKARDEIVKGLWETISGATKHPDPVKRDAAKQLKIVCDTYGNIAVKSLNEQTSDTTNIVQDFEGTYASKVAALGLAAWVVELKARNITLRNLIQDRLEESTAKNDMALKEARERVDEKHQAIVTRINALAEVEGAAAYEHFIKKRNISIAKYKLLMPKNSKKGKKDEN